MASLFEHLFDSLPFATLDASVLRAYRSSLKNPGGFKAPPIGLLSWMTYFNSTPVQPSVAYVPDVPEDGVSPELARIFGFEPAADASSFGRLWCRVRENAYRPSIVFEQLRFGAENESGVLEPSIAVTLDQDELKLPLEEKFLFQQWYIRDVSLIDRESHWWPLGCIIDWSFLRVFVYDIDIVTGAISPYDPKNDPDSVELDAAQEATKVFLGIVEAVMLLGLGEDDGSAPELPNFSSALTTLLRGNFMPTAAEARLTATVPAEKEISVGKVRVLALVSLTVNRERADFEPGAIIGMGRIHPHVIVKASVPLSRVRASVEIVRPVESDTRGCCHEMRTMINPILVSDANRDTQLSTFFGSNLPVVGPVPPPFWSNLFGYYASFAAGGSSEPYPPPTNQNLRGQRLHMVDSSKTTERVSVGQVYRLEYGQEAPSGLEAATTVEEIEAMKNPGDNARSFTINKLRRQGEFDNLHMAPTMWWDVNVFRDPLTKAYKPITDRQALRLDAIVMAPFCAHDCFHVHWRWLDNAPGSAFFVFGWSEAGPYTEPGMCMVPLNQDVYLTITSPHSFIYTAVAESRIDIGEPQFFVHHGLAYGLYAAEYKVKAARVATELQMLSMFGKQEDLGAQSIFLPNTATLSTPFDSWAALYWNMRYVATRSPHESGTDEALNEWRAVERTVILDFEGVRKL